MNRPRLILVCSVLLTLCAPAFADEPYEAPTTFGPFYTDMAGYYVNGKLIGAPGSLADETGKLSLRNHVMLTRILTATLSIDGDGFSADGETIDGAAYDIRAKKFFDAVLDADDADIVYVARWTDPEDGPFASTYMVGIESSAGAITHYEFAANVFNNKVIGMFFSKAEGEDLPTFTVSGRDVIFPTSTVFGVDLVP